MLLDEYTEFCDATSVVGDAGTALLGDVIDLGATSRDIGNGEPLYFVINVDTEIVTAGITGSITFSLASDAQAAIATDGSATVHVSSAAIVTDDAAVNGVLCNAGSYPMYVAIPQGTTFERYLGVLCTIATQSVTAGKINAFLTTNPAGNPAYPDAL